MSTASSPFSPPKRQSTTIVRVSMTKLPATSFTLLALFDTRCIFVGIELSPVIGATEAEIFCKTIREDLPKQPNHTTLSVKSGFFIFTNTVLGQEVRMPHTHEAPVATRFAALLKADKKDPSTLGAGVSRYQTSDGVRIAMQESASVSYEPIKGD